MSRNYQVTEVDAGKVWQVVSVDDDLPPAREFELRRRKRGKGTRRSRCQDTLNADDCSDEEDASECPTVPAVPKQLRTVCMRRCTVSSDDGVESYCYLQCDCGFWERNLMVCRHVLAVRGGELERNLLLDVHLRWFKFFLTTEISRSFGDGRRGASIGNLPIPLADEQHSSGGSSGMDQEFDVDVPPRCSGAAVDWFKCAQQRADHDMASHLAGLSDDDKQVYLGLSQHFQGQLAEVVSLLATLDVKARKAHCTELDELLAQFKRDVIRENGTADSLTVDHRIFKGNRASNFSYASSAGKKTKPKKRSRAAAAASNGASAHAGDAAPAERRRCTRFHKSAMDEAPAASSTDLSRINEAEQEAECPKRKAEIVKLKAAFMARLRAEFENGCEVNRVDSCIGGTAVDQTVVKDWQQLPSAAPLRHLWRAAAFFHTPVWSSLNLTNTCPVDSGLVALHRYLLAAPDVLAALRTVSMDYAPIVSGAVVLELNPVAAAAAIVDMHDLALAQNWGAARARFVWFLMFETTWLENESAFWTLTAENKISIQSNAYLVYRALSSALPESMTVRRRIEYACSRVNCASQRVLHSRMDTVTGLTRPTRNVTLEQAVNAGLRPPSCCVPKTEDTTEHRQSCRSLRTRTVAEIEALPLLLDIYMRGGTGQSRPLFGLHELPVNLRVAETEYVLDSVCLYNGNHFVTCLRFDGNGSVQQHSRTSSSSSSSTWVLNDCIARPTTIPCSVENESVRLPPTYAKYSVMGAWYRKLDSQHDVSTGVNNSQ